MEGTAIKENILKTLISLKQGEGCRISGMDLPPSITKRLFELGLHTGAQVTMKKNNIGPCIVGIHHATIALGRNLCSNIYIKSEESKTPIRNAQGDLR